MSTGTQEIIRLCEALPEEKRAEVADFARYLLSRAGYPDDHAWEQRLADPRPLPKLEAFLRESAAEGGDEPLDLERLADADRRADENFLILDALESDDVGGRSGQNRV